MKNLAISLCRVSTPEQRESNSLNRQEIAVRQAAQELQVEIIKNWSGDVSSKAGTNAARRDLLEMFAFCKSTKAVKYLIVDEPDRFMRSTDEAPFWEVNFRLIGVTVWYASDPELNKQELPSKLLKYMRYYQAEASNEERQRKSISGHVQALKEGRYTFPPKPGYMKGELPGIHVPHPATFRPLQRALKEVIDGKSTPGEALKRLMSSEFGEFYERWGMDKFRHFATDPYYAGVLTMDRQVKVERSLGQHRPMITEQEHEKLVQIFSSTLKIRGAKKQYNPEFPMAKVLSCTDCGAKFTGHRKHNGYAKKTVKYYWKYRCRGCGREYDRVEVHEILTNYLRALRITDIQRNDFTRALEAVWRQRQKDKVQQIGQLEKRRLDVAQRKSNLVIRLASESGPLADDIKTEIDKTRSELATLDKQMEQVRGFEDDMAQFVNFALQYTDNLVEDWWDLGYEDRVRCQQLIFPGGISLSSDKKVSTPGMSPLYTFKLTKKDLRKDRKSLMVELEGIAPSSDW